MSCYFSTKVTEFIGRLIDLKSCKGRSVRNIRLLTNSLEMGTTLCIMYVEKHRFNYSTIYRNGSYGRRHGISMLYLLCFEGRSNEQSSLYAIEFFHHTVWEMTYCKNKYKICDLDVLVPRTSLLKPSIQKQYTDLKPIDLIACKKF